MPKLPPMSGAEVVRALKIMGFVVVRQKGSHIVLRKEAQGCVVPNHHEVKTGTLHGLLRQAGVDENAFLQALRS